MTESFVNRWLPGSGRKRDSYPLAVEDLKREIPVADLGRWLVDESTRQRAEDHLDWYLTRYAGRQFEWFAEKGRGRRFSSFHVLAAESLSVTVPPTAARWLLEPDNSRDALLNQIHQSLVPGSDTLWTCDVELLRGSKQALNSSGALYQLYWNLRTLGTYNFKRGGIGEVTTSKLLAAMYPAVLPVRDSMIEALLGLDDQDNWWMIVRELLGEGGDSLVRLLDGLRIPEDSEKVTTLRRLDIVLWMEANARGFGSRSASKTSSPRIEEEM